MAKDIMKEFGLSGFFHGCFPPLIGSAIYRGIMMSSYEFSFSYIELNFDSTHPLKQEYLYCIRPIVPLSVVFCSLFRGVIEGIMYYKCFVVVHTCINLHITYWNDIHMNI